MNRRQILGATLALAGTHLVLPQGLRAVEPKRKRLAAVNSIYFKLSHAYHIEGRFINGYNLKGEVHRPAFDVVRMFNHQTFADGKYQDLSKSVAAKTGMKLTPTIADALGGKANLDVDGVLLIVEHGDYPRNDRGQILYPRYEFFQQIVEVFKASGRSVPVFVDKHLSYDHVKVRAMYDTAKTMGFPLMAGSSLPVTWRRPEWELPHGAKVEEAVVCFYADLEIYGLHALEVLQCLLERRSGGETGVKCIRTLRGNAVWEAWDRGDWSKELAETALRRSATRDYGKPRDHVADPVAILVEYLDGTRGTLLHLPGYVADLTAAVRLKGDPKPQSTLFLLPAPPGARFFDPLTYWIEQFLETGQTPYPVERTLLTSTMLDFAMRSAAEGNKLMTDPALKVAYQTPNRSWFFKGSMSDD